MFWYGLKFTRSNKHLWNRQSQNLNYKIKKYGFDKTLKKQVNKQSFLLYKPSNWEVILLKSKTNNNKIVVFYSNIYFFKLSLPGICNEITFDENTNTVLLHTMYINNYYRLFWSTLVNTFYALTRPVFKKIKFKGKGYYIYKNLRGTITPQFGYSHRLYVYSFFTSVKFLSKTTVFIFGLLKRDIDSVGLAVKNLRPINIFTGRGVRFSKQIVYKKVGKVSSYR